MSWSYSGDPSTSDLDAVRFWIGDTDQADQLVQDEEIDFLLGRYSDPLAAAAHAAEALAAKFARLVDKTLGDYSVKLSQKVEHYRQLAKSLDDMAKGKLKLVSPYAGGISISDKMAQERDRDRVKPRFRRGMMDSG